ncbi:MAG TPA: immunoglobulin domain-containing protein [Opitutaceae bacterium]
MDASVEAGEPGHAGIPGGASVWWTWTAPADGTAVFTVNGRPDGTVLVVYTGESLATLSRVASNEASVHGYLRSRAILKAVAGTSYQLAVDGMGGISSDLTLELVLTEGPENDLFSSAREIAGTETNAIGNNLGATREENEPIPTAYGTGSLWWAWRAPRNGRAVLRADGTHPGSAVRVHSGSSLQALELVTSGVQSLARNYIVFDATEGAAYQIALEQTGQTTADFTLSLDLVDPPANDRIVDRIPVSEFPVVVHGNNLGAAPDEGEDVLAGYPADSSVWWTWTAQTSGPVILSTAGTEIETRFAVFNGSATANLHRVGLRFIDFDEDESPRFVFDAVAGTSYQIKVTGVFGAMGDNVFRMSAAEPPSLSTVQPATSLANPGPRMVLSANAAGLGALRYQWMDDGEDIPGATDATFTIPSVQWFHSGRYAVRVGDAFGETIGPPVYFAVENTPLSKARLLNLSTRALCLTGDDVLIPTAATSVAEPKS